MEQSMDKQRLFPDNVPWAIEDVSATTRPWQTGVVQIPCIVSYSLYGPCLQQNIEHIE